MGIDEGRENNAFPKINLFSINFVLNRFFFSDKNYFPLRNSDHPIFYRGHTDRINPPSLVLSDICFQFSF